MRRPILLTVWLLFLLTVPASAEGGSPAWRAADLTPGSGRTEVAPIDAVLFDGRLFFTGRDPVVGHELWASDGTAKGLRLIADLTSSPARPPRKSGSDGVHGRELWSSDGTAEGTRLLYDAYRDLRSSEPYGFVRAGGLVFFAARDGAGVELWAADAVAL